MALPAQNPKSDAGPECRTSVRPLEAKAVAERIGQRRTLWQILAVLAEIEEQQGNISEARSYRDEARNIIDYIAGHAGSELRSSFLSMPQVMSLLKNV